MSEDRPVMPQRRSRFLLAVVSVLLVGLVGFGSLLALGILEVRRAGRSAEKPTGSEPGASSQPSVADQTTPTAKVTNVTSSSPLMPFVDSSGHCFKYEGAWVECLIEIEENGQKTVVAEITANLKNNAQAANRHNDRLKGKPPSGYIAWVSSSEGDQKVWHLWANVIDPETGEPIATMTRSTPKAHATPRSVDITGTPGGPLKAGKDTVLVTRTVFEDEKVVRTARLVCRVSE